ncbi:MAG TPA: cytidine deaminase [Actinomycetota bacterium]|nr:cytidine deaminase [Actinomycetota bacterium]
MAEAADADELLVAAARAARERAYAPYSAFPVGAAVRTDAGTFTGANVENASYGLSICAERVAAAAAVASGARRIEAVALVSAARTPTPPCGACRQFLYEFGAEMTVISEAASGARRAWRLSELLADGFGPDDLAAAR